MVKNQIYSLLLPNGWTRELSSTPHLDKLIEITTFRELYVQQDFALVLVYQNSSDKVVGLVIGILGVLNIIAPACNSNEIYCEYFLKEYLKPFPNLDFYDSSKTVAENIDGHIGKFIENATRLNISSVDSVIQLRNSLIDFFNNAVVDVYVGSTGSKIWKAFQPLLDKPAEDIWNYYVDDSKYLMDNGLLPKTRCKPAESRLMEPKYDLHAQNAKLYEMIETEKNFVQCLEFLDFAYNEFLLNWKNAGFASQSIIKFTVIPVSNLLAAHKAYLTDLENAGTPLVMCQIFQMHIKLIIPPTTAFTLAHDQLRYIKQDRMKNSKPDQSKNNKHVNTPEFRKFVARIEQMWEQKTGKTKYLGDELQKPTGRIIGYQSLFEALYKYSGNEKIIKDTYELSVRSAKKLNHSLVANHMENMMQQIHIKTQANFQFTYDGERITFLTDFDALEVQLYKDRYYSQPVILLIFSKFIQVLKKGKSDFVNAGHYLLKDTDLYKSDEGFVLLHSGKTLYFQMDSKKTAELLGLIKHLKIKDNSLQKYPAYVDAEKSTIYYRILYDKTILESNDIALILLEDESDYAKFMESVKSNVLMVVAVNADGKFKVVKRINRHSPLESISESIPDEYEWKSFSDLKQEMANVIHNAGILKYSSPKFTLFKDQDSVKQIVKQSLCDMIIVSKLPQSHSRIKTSQSFKSLAPSTNSIQQLLHKISIKRRNTSIATGSSKFTPSISNSISFRNDGRMGILNNFKTIFKKEASNHDVLGSITGILHIFIETRIKNKEEFLPPSNNIIEELKVNQFINSIIKCKPINIKNYSSQFLVHSITTFFKNRRQLIFTNEDKRYMMNGIVNLTSDQEIIGVLKEYFLKNFSGRLALYETFFSQINELVLAKYDLAELGMYLVAIDESDRENAHIVFDNLLFNCHSMFKLPNDDDTRSVFSFMDKVEEEQGRRVEYKVDLQCQNIPLYTYPLPRPIETGFQMELYKFDYNDKRQQLQTQEEDTLVELVKMTASSSLDMEFIESMKLEDAKKVMSPTGIEEMLKQFSTPIEVTSDFFKKTLSSIDE
ncbi:hypothetical protein HDV01_005532 [Terramyces sp. JEL0728]|nr:hypothetical protein HDV01_005532 [Terramyces sp. JEL0728]